MLNANQSNYSFGGLHLIFEQLFDQIEIGNEKIILIFKPTDLN